ncbi:hypothetical protein VTK26DRAFT_1449 [Humicola hyalothermophila]
MTSLGSWLFTPLPAFPATVFPNVALWNDPLTMYVLDGNALGMSAAESFKRRKPVDSAQPDSVVVSVGYPLTDNVYAFPRRFIDFRPPLPVPQEYPSNADDLIEFLDDVVRPWVRSTVFPNVTFTRDALYGHSFGGLFETYAMITHPELFDTFISSSPAVMWNNGSILDDVTKRLGSGSPPCLLRAGDEGSRCRNGNDHGTNSRPASFVSYGSLEDWPVKRRTETEAEFKARKDMIKTYHMAEYCHELYNRVSGKMRDVLLKI